MLGLRHSADAQSIMHTPNGSAWGSGAPIETWCGRPVQDDLLILTTNLGPHVARLPLPAPSDASGPEIRASVAGTPRVLNVTATDASALRYVMLRAYVDLGDPRFNRPTLLAEKVQLAPPYVFDVSELAEDATLQVLAVDRWDNLTVKTF